MKNFEFKAKPWDFIVEETLKEKPTGQGRYLYIFIEKKNINTYDIVYELMNKMGFTRKQIGIAGIKDKIGITRQWFSFDKDILKGKRNKDDLIQLFSSMCKILTITSHEKLLKVGENRGNLFFIRLRNKGPKFGNKINSNIEPIINKITNNGFPNYFGSQRFGLRENNRKIGKDILLGKYPIQKLGKNYKTESVFKIQAFTSYIFNEILDYRINNNLFDEYLDGDILVNSENKKDLHIYDKNIHKGFPYVSTGPIIGFDLMISAIHNTNEDGTYKILSTNPAFDIENKIIKSHRLNIENLLIFQKFDMFGVRRALKIFPKDFKLKFTKEGDVLLSFELNPGAYASILVEYIDSMI